MEKTFKHTIYYLTFIVTALILGGITFYIISLSPNLTALLSMIYGDDPNINPLLGIAALMLTSFAINCYPGLYVMSLILSIKQLKINEKTKAFIILLIPCISLLACLFIYLISTLIFNVMAKF